MGQDSLRYGLLATLVAMCASCWYYYRTGAFILRTRDRGNSVVSLILLIDSFAHLIDRLNGN